MSTETKVGAFVMAGLLLMGTAIFLLGDFTLEKRYPLYVLFHDVGGLSSQSPVKLSGVEVGIVRDILLEGSQAKVVLSLRHGVPVYRDAALTVGSTGIIGSKYLQIDQGRPESGAWPPGSVLNGVDPVSIEKALAKALGGLQDLLGGLNGEEGKRGPAVRNLNGILANVRSLTANLDEMIGDVKPGVTEAMNRMDAITAKLDAILAKTDAMMEAINSSKGPVGAMLHDEKMKEDVQETVSSLKDVAGTARDMLGRINQFRVYWNYDWRYEHAIRTSRGDIGLKIVPREGRYYYLGGSNLGNISDLPRGTDYVRKNTVDALLGFVWGGWDLGVGVIRSGGGAKATWTPVPGDSAWGRLSLFAQGYDFGRNRTIEGRRFTHPEYDFGAMVRLHRMVGLGARLEDVQETRRYQTWINVNFEDRDIAYLLGMASFGAAGTRGRSKNR